MPSDLLRGPALAGTFLSKPRLRLLLYSSEQAVGAHHGLGG